MKTTDVSLASFDIRFHVLQGMGLRGIPRTDRRLVRTTAQKYLNQLLSEDIGKAQETVEALVLRLYRNAQPDAVVSKLRKSDKLSSFQQASRVTGMEHGKKIADGGHLSEEELRFWIVPSGKNVHSDGKLAPNVFELLKHVKFVEKNGETVEVGEFEELNATLIAMADAQDYSPTLKVAIQAELDRRAAETESSASPPPASSALMDPDTFLPVVPEKPEQQNLVVQPEETSVPKVEDIVVPEPGLDMSIPVEIDTSVESSAQPEEEIKTEAPTEAASKPVTKGKGKGKGKTAPAA